MNIDRAREAIDAVDCEMLELFLRRMEQSAAIAQEKGKTEMPIRDLEREKLILDKIAAKSGKMTRFSTELFSTVMALSRAYQRELLAGGEGGAFTLGGEIDSGLLKRMSEILGVSEQELHCDVGSSAFALEIALKRAKIEIIGKKVLIFGSGGAARAAQRTARKNNAARVSLIAPEGDEYLSELLRLSDSELIINATVVGAYPDCCEAPFSLGLFPCCEGVADFVCSPLRTRLIMDAKRRGIPSVGGLSILLYQALCAQELFSGKPFDGENAEALVNTLFKDRLNIAVIGMPGSGKTSVSRELADISGKRLYCIDQELAKETGMSAETIIKTYGEQRFRAYEREQIARAGALNGLIIDTGGGAVTVPENYASLHQNSMIYCLERDLDKLETNGRPLSSNMEALIRVREIRGPMYAAFADKKQENNSGTIRETAQRIWDDFCKSTQYFAK